MTTDDPRCDRCEEPIRPVVFNEGIAPRITGSIKHVTHDITWRNVTERWGARMSADRTNVTFTQVSLCDECWGALLSWVNDPQQERAKIAAENRRRRARVEKVAQERREKQVQRFMKEGTGQ